ncbi:MAG: thioredoxin family protein [Gracilibacteraceae bacterium]|jgi:thioredoxin 1|nr:thioredoxin family protein [Gracilibacteraceae bacterium]
MQELTSAVFDEAIYDQGGACLVMFSRPGCHVCQSVTPILEDMAPQYEGRCAFYKVDVEQSPTLRERFSLKGVPVILFFSDGEYRSRLAGPVEEETVAAKIEALF